MIQDRILARHHGPAGHGDSIISKPVDFLIRKSGVVARLANRSDVLVLGVPEAPSTFSEGKEAYFLRGCEAAETRWSL